MPNDYAQQKANGYPKAAMSDSDAVLNLQGEDFNNWWKQKFGSDYQGSPSFNLGMSSKNVGMPKAPAEAPALAAALNIPQLDLVNMSRKDVQSYLKLNKPNLSWLQRRRAAKNLMMGYNNGTLNATGHMVELKPALVAKPVLPTAPVAPPIEEETPYTFKGFTGTDWGGGKNASFLNTLGHQFIQDKIDLDGDGNVTQQELLNFQKTLGSGKMFEDGKLGWRAGLAIMSMYGNDAKYGFGNSAAVRGLGNKPVIKKGGSSGGVVVPPAQDPNGAMGADGKLHSKDDPHSKYHDVPDVPNTGQSQSSTTSIFNYADVVKNAGSDGTEVTINGKKYLRYDPSGAGDWFIGEDGKVYESNWFGHSGRAALGIKYRGVTAVPVDKSTVGSWYNTGDLKNLMGWNKQGGKLISKK